MKIKMKTNTYIIHVAEPRALSISAPGLVFEIIKKGFRPTGRKHARVLPQREEPGT